MIIHKALLLIKPHSKKFQTHKKNCFNKLKKKALYDDIR